MVPLKRDSTLPRVVVVGASIAGLTAGIALREAGCDVEVFERSPAALTGLGAGIVLHRKTVEVLENYGISYDSVGARGTHIRYLGARGETVFEAPLAHRFTSWNTLYRNLFAVFGSERLHRARALAGWAQDADGVTVNFDDGHERRCDLLVCGDGIQSTARRILAPETEIAYAGYYAWRGTALERDLSPGAFASVNDTLTYCVLEKSHVITYPIPYHDGSIEPGTRLINFVWYRNLAEGPELDDLMTGRDGGRRPLSVQPGMMQPRHEEACRELARELLPPPYEEIVSKIEHPFVQLIVDVESPRMRDGRVCVIGDAAFVARPHPAAGSAKAAEDAITLAAAITAAGGHVAAALSAWEPGQLELGRNLVARAREMGNRSQVTQTWIPEEMTPPYGLYAPGD